MSAKLYAAFLLYLNQGREPSLSRKLNLFFFMTTVISGLLFLFYFALDLPSVISERQYYIIFISWLSFLECSLSPYLGTELEWFTQYGKHTLGCCHAQTTLTSTYVLF